MNRAEAADSPVEPPGRVGTPVEPVSDGSDAPGGHWCPVADDLAAQLSAAEDELAAVKARMRQELRRSYDGGEFCQGTYEALRACLEAAGVR